MGRMQHPCPRTHPHNPPRNSRRGGEYSARGTTSVAALGQNGAPGWHSRCGRETTEGGCRCSSRGGSPDGGAPRCWSGCGCERPGERVRRVLQGSCRTSPSAASGPALQNILSGCCKIRARPPWPRPQRLGPAAGRGPTRDAAPKVAARKAPGIKGLASGAPGENSPRCAFNFGLVGAG